MGSKAYNLQQLISSGFNVPPLVVIYSENPSREEIQKLVDETLGDCQLFAVRSSAQVEDGKEKSYAGHFHSEVAVKRQDIFDAFLRVRKSYAGAVGEVIIQQFIPSQCAGVIFTNDGSGIMVINSNIGLCKTVVEGEACDEIYVTREGKVLSKHIEKYKKPLVFSDGLKSIEVEDTESITDAQILKLTSEALRIEELFGCPQDVEWCFYQDDLHIFQSRPITRFPSKKNWVFYDSANIAESYSGVVLPLTHSFASNIYKKVYENLLIASGASRKRIERNQPIFSNMVSNFFGRMYYNMNNWYLMMSFMPGYNRNKGNLEGMLTSNIRVEVPRSVLPSVWLKISYPFILVYKLLFFRYNVNRFKKKVRAAIRFFRSQSIETFSIKECVDAYQAMNNELLEQFHIPVENDFLLMTYLGTLRKKYDEEKLKSLIAFDNVSSRQVESIAQLSALVFSNSDLARIIDTNDYSKFTDALKRYPLISNCFNHYFEQYGGRFANELKLESPDIEFDKNALFDLLKIYKSHSPGDTKKSVNRDVRSGFVLNRFIKYASQREELRLLRSNCFSIVRRIFRRLGVLLAQKGVLLKPEDVFYLSIDEVMIASNGSFLSDYRTIVAVRRNEYEEYKKITPPVCFSTFNGGKPFVEKNEHQQLGLLQGRSCTAGIVRGRIRVFSEFTFPGEVDFDIMVARNTDPGWAALIGLSKGIIVENGGILSHAAIVSRELGIPTVIGVPNVTQILKTGQVVEMNGETGEIKLIIAEDENRC